MRLFCLISAPLALATIVSAEEKEPRCRLMGTIFSQDPLAATLLVKDPTGYIEDVRFSSKTTFLKLPIGAGGPPAPVSAVELSSGDLVCVHGGAGEIPEQISVVTRADIQRAQREFLVEWQRSCVFGTIVSIDVPARTFVVAPVSPSVDQGSLTISLPASAQLSAARPTARRLADSTSFRFEELQVGEPVYVRGTRSGSEPAIAASLVLKGGWRGILGTLVEVQPLGSVIKIREFGTGRSLRITLPGAELYRTTESVTHPMRLETKSGVILAPVGFADIQTGDAVLIIGKTNDQTAEGEGLVVVTKFGTFGVVPHDPQERVVWFLKK
jgi:hypothetical protein